MITETQLYSELKHLLDKRSIPTILVDDFNILANDAIYHFVQSRYREYDLTQNIADDLQILSRNILYKSNGVFDFEKNPVIKFNNNTDNLPNLVVTEEGIAYNLPSDYMHLTNCVIKYIDKSCNLTRVVRAKRFTAESKASIVDNEWLKPSRDRIYYYIRGTMLEVLFGNEDIEIEYISIEYLKLPQPVTLTPAQLIPDTSKPLEFNDLTVKKIRDELIHRTLELVEHQVRQQTRPPIDQKIL